MKTVWCWIKFFLIHEANPIKRQEYFAQANWFIEDIQSALAQKDTRRLLQYGCVLLPFTITLALYIFVYGPDLTEFEAIIWVDIFRWVHTDRSLYVLACTYLLLGVLYLYLIHVPIETKYFRNNFEKLIVKAEPISYFWPYQYKQQNCSTVIRKIFFRIFRFCQTGIITLGDIFF